jgi:enoyl-CoA hydratase/carnithine racemase
MNFRNLLWDETDDGVVAVTFNRPDDLNPISLVRLAELNAAVSKVVPHGQLMDDAMALARKLPTKAPLALASCKAGPQRRGRHRCGVWAHARTSGSDGNGQHQGPHRFRPGHRAEARAEVRPSLKPMRPPGEA